MRNLHSSVNKSDLIDGLDFRGKTTMDAEDFTFDNSTNAKVIENLCAVFPRVGISILPNSLIVETINRGDLSSLMITSKESNVSWVLHLKTEKKLESFD